MAEINGRVGWRNYVSPLPNPLWNGMLAYYTADNTADDAKGTANGTLTNGATYGTGKINGGFSFDGINDTITLSNTVTKFSSSTPFTYNVWVKAVSRTGFIYMDANSSASGTSIGFYGGTIAFTIGDVAQWFGSGIVIPLNTWTMVTITYNGIVNQSNNLLFYTNGTFAYGLNMNVPFSLPTASSNKQIGSGGWRSFFNGNLDELGIWGRALTASEVTELYNAGAGKQYVAPAPTSIITTGLVMNLDASNALSYAGTGTTWTDLSGNANNGTLINGTSYSSANGGTMVFDGINDMVSVAHSPNLNSTKITVSMWIKFGSSLSTDKVLFSKGSEGSRTYWFYESNGVYFAYGGWTGRIPAEILVNQWCNIVGVQTSTASLIYLNGVLYSSGAGAASITTTQGIGINSYSSNIYHASAKNIPQVAIYNRDLSASEVATNFAALKSRYGL